MKKAFLISIVFLLYAAGAIAGELSVKNANVPGATVLDFKYKADSRWLSSSQLQLIVYCFENSRTNPVAFAEELTMSKTGGLRTARFSVPQSAVFCTFAVTDGEMTDNKHQEFWDYKKLSDNGNPVKGAYLKEALSYMGNLPANCARNIDLRKAYKLMQKEVRLYPKNITAQIAFLTMKLDLKEIENDEFTNDIRQILKLPYDTEDEEQTKAVSRAHRVINQPNNAERLEKLFVDKHPQTDLAEERYMSQLSKVKTLIDFRDKVTEYLSKYPNSQNTERLYAAVMTGYLQVGEYDNAYRYLNERQHVPATALTQLAFAIGEAEDGKVENKDMKIMALIQRANRESEKPKNNLKPEYLTEKEWKERRQLNKVNVKEAEAMYFMQTDQSQLALEKYLEMKDMLGDNATNSIYEMIVDTYLKLDKKQEAYDIAAESIRNAKGSFSLEAKHDSLFKELGLKGDYEKVIATLHNTAYQSSLDKMKYSRLDAKVNLGIVKNLEDTPIDLSAYKGKVIVLTFWSTWCDPCSESLGGFQSLFEAYQDDDSILLSAINVWENGEDPMSDIQQYVNDTELNIPMLVDESGEMLVDMGITGLPVQVIIDKSGKIAYRDGGYLNEYKYLRDTNYKIKYLMAE